MKLNITKISILATILLFSLRLTLFAQHKLLFNFETFPELSIQLPDTIKYVENQTYLGENLVVKGGDGEYYYGWEPAGSVDNAFSNNPLFIDPSIPQSIILTVNDSRGCNASDTIVIQITSSSSNNEVEQLFNVYPNPAKNEIIITTEFVDMDDWNIEIASNDGKILFTKLLSMLPHGIINISKLNLNPGTYTIILRNEEYVGSKKIIIH